MKINPKRTEKQLGVGEMSNRKGNLGLGKTPEEPKSKRVGGGGVGWKNSQPEGGPRGG